VEEIAVDHAAESWARQGVVAPHQIPDLEAAVLADGLQRRDYMSDAGAVRERQQQPLIGDDPAVDVVDVGDGVDGQGAGEQVW
jgi:hypothetical protein